MHSEGGARTVITGPAYSAARAASREVQPHFLRALSASKNGQAFAAALPEQAESEAIIDAAFWASLRREEGRSPKISLAFLPPDEDGRALQFAHPLPLSPEDLVGLAPAVERPGIHLGVWRSDDGLFVWGATRNIPPFCFVLEVVSPGLLVIKHRRDEGSAKYINVAVLEGDRVKILDQDVPSAPYCPDLVSALIGFDRAGHAESFNALVELAASMRTHGRGGALLYVPADHDTWLESIVQPIHYAVTPPFSRLGELMREEEGQRTQPRWLDAFRRAVDAIAGLTSVDGATVINHRFDVLAFGAKIGRRRNWPQVEQIILTEPVIGVEPRTVMPVQAGGTRHLSAAQFVHDQRDAVALVASQDGRFTIFEWSPCEDMVHAHRVEALLL